MRRTPLKISDFTKTQADRFAFFLGTGFGVGVSPFAPGTLGSLVGLAIAYKAAFFPISLQWTLFLITTVVGTWAAGRVTEVSHTQDHPSIVVDEVIGMWLVCFGIDMNALLTPWLAFAAFRFFDIVKPFPIRRVDAWSKKQGGRKIFAGVGVMVDDVLAALMALSTVHIILRIVVFALSLEMTTGVE
jgi:phosphatidylglycerophosphatase A